jgi:hypothetical protein
MLMNMKDTFKCSLCGTKSWGYGHNPQPLKESVNDRCCSECNLTKVIPSRLAQLQGVEYVGE